MSIDDIAGLIPMAGRASRLGKIPFSKELYPILFGKDNGIKSVSSFLIESMKKAGVKNYHLILRDGKWDIPSYFGSGKDFKVNFCYHIAKYGYGVPFTINQAYPFIKNKLVVLGFPDILFEPHNAFNYLLDKLNEHETSVVLGIIPVDNPESWDMVEVDKDGFVSKIHIKPKKVKNLKYNWFIAAWKPEFSIFLHNFVESLLHDKTKNFLDNNELYFGDILNAAIQEGMEIKYEVFPNSKCLDIGTVEGLKKSKTFFN